MKKIVVLFILFFAVYTNLTAQRHVFYLHGMIVENMGANAVDNVNGYGAYKYNDIVDSLKKQGFTVISEVRPKNTNVQAYAQKVKSQIEELLKKGVPANQITVIGASKGALIAMTVSSILLNKEVNYVFMAACSEQSYEMQPPIRFYGNVLSIYEKSDGPSSCRLFLKRSPPMKHYKEIEINTGLKHGFLYRPIADWFQPAVKWAKGNYD